MYNHVCITGTVYLQQTSPFLIMSGFCVYSVASALFMFPAIYGYLYKALTIYSFEKADGAGSAADLVLQSFIRFTSIALIPVIFCAGLLYMLVRHKCGWIVFLYLLYILLAFFRIVFYVCSCSIPIKKLLILVSPAD